MNPFLLKRLANTLLALVITLFVIWVIAALVYYKVEDYRLIDCFHFAMQTLSTTGYGDVPPKTDSGKILAMVVQPQALVMTALFFANFTARAVHNPDVFSHDEQVEARACDDDTNKKVTKLLDLVTQDLSIRNK